MRKQLFTAGMGVGLGMAAGAALGLAMTDAKKRKLKKAADKAMRTVSEMAEDFSDRIRM